MKLELPPGAKLVPCGKGFRIVYADDDTGACGVDGDTRTSQATANESVERQEAANERQRGNGPLAQLAPSDSPARTAGSIPAKRPPKQPRKPNKTEAKYACEFLINKPGVEWGYEQIKLRLGGESVYYVPDFFVMRNGKPELHEVKACHRFAEKGRLKWRWARDSWGHVFKFVFALRVKGGWEIEE